MKLLRVTVDQAGQRLDRWLATRLEQLSRARLQQLIAAGSVTVDGRPAAAAAKTRLGQEVVVEIAPEPDQTPQPEALPLEILYEDSDLLVINKPPGMVVHPAPGHPAGTLVNALLHYSGKLAAVGSCERPGIVHRLDKDTSGLLLVARNETTRQALVAQFHDHLVGKEYLALVHGIPVPGSGRVETTIGRHPVDRKKMAVNPPHGKRAVSHYETCHTGGGMALLRVRIETGRTHQIRLHLAHLGLPLVGDPLYGSRQLDRRLPLPPPRQLLHAARLAFTHPASSQPLTFEAPFPADMAHFMAHIWLGWHEPC